MNRFKATLAIAAFSILALTACGGDATKVADDAKNAVDQTAKTATEGANKAGEGAMKAGEGAMKAGEGAMKAGDTAKDAVGGVATKAGEGAMKAGDTAKDAVGGVATKAGEGAMKAGDTAKDAVGGIAGKMTGAAGLLSLTQTIPALKTGVTAALDDVKKGDFKAAKEEATKLQESWTKVGDVVKTKSGGSFDKISSTLKTVQTELGESSPDKAKIISDLTSLSSSVTGLASIK
jgi:hypothetical protein